MFSFSVHPLVHIKKNYKRTQTFNTIKQVHPSDLMMIMTLDVDERMEASGDGFDVFFYFTLIPSH